MVLRKPHKASVGTSYFKMYRLSLGWKYVWKNKWNKMLCLDRNGAKWIIKYCTLCMTKSTYTPSLCNRWPNSSSIWPHRVFKYKTYTEFKYLHDWHVSGSLNLKLNYYWNVVTTYCVTNRQTYRPTNIQSAKSSSTLKNSPYSIPDIFHGYT